MRYIAIIGAALLAGLGLAETGKMDIHESEYRDGSDVIDDEIMRPAPTYGQVLYSVSEPSAGVSQRLVEKNLAPLIDTLVADYNGYLRKEGLLDSTGRLDLRLTIDEKGVIKAVDIMNTEVDPVLSRIVVDDLEFVRIPKVAGKAFIVELSLDFQAM